jgi:hypothetical protein
MFIANGIELKFILHLQNYLKKPSLCAIAISGQGATCGFSRHPLHRRLAGNPAIERDFRLHDLNLLLPSLAQAHIKFHAKTFSRTRF